MDLCRQSDIKKWGRGKSLVLFIHLFIYLGCASKLAGSQFPGQGQHLYLLWRKLRAGNSALPTNSFFFSNQFLNVFLLFINFNIPSFYLFNLKFQFMLLNLFLFHPIFVFIFKHCNELSRCFADISLFNSPDNHVG